MTKLKKTKVTAKEKARRNRILFWAVVVLVVNLLQILFKNWITSLIAMVGTIYALIALAVYLLLFIWYAKQMKKRNAEYAAAKKAN